MGRRKGMEVKGKGREMERGKKGKGGKRKR